MGLLSEIDGEIRDNIQKSGRGVIGSGYGWSLIHQYSAYGHALAVELLLEKGIEVDARSKCDDTLLVCAASASGHADVVQVLLARGAEINAQGYQGRTALMQGSKWGKVEVVKLLLDGGADIEVRNDEGKTAWDIAKKSHLGKPVKPLLKKAGGGVGGRRYF
jgi:ankyrin repeat protein